MNTPGGRERLFALGLRKVPILARGKEWVHGIDLKAMAKFIGHKGELNLQALPPDVLVERLITILRTAQSIVSQIPEEKLRTDAVHNRKRHLRQLSHHVFRIGEAWLEVASGKDFVRGMGESQLTDDEFRTADDIARYGGSVADRIEQWWEGVKDDKGYFQTQRDSFFGPTNLHVILERCTWHPAQHTRQIASVLEGLGIQLKQPLTPEMLAGLPLPERLWE